jgi:hypothetical protein
VQAYLALRRAAGFEMSNAGYLLARLCRFAVERGHRLGQPSPIRDQRDERLKPFVDLRGTFALKIGAANCRPAFTSQRDNGMWRARYFGSSRLAAAAFARSS